MWLRPAGMASITSCVEHALLRGALHVDDRRLAGDRDRLLERADAHVGVDRGDEGAGQLDPVALDDVLKPGSEKVTV